MKKQWFVGLISVSILILDQLVKHLIVSSFSLHQSLEIIPNVLWFTYIQNTGAGFGIFHDSNIILIFVSLMIIGYLFFIFEKFDKKVLLPYALVIGGAFGNLIDRIFRGFVVDYVDLGWWPAFNIADSCIVVGVIWLTIFYWKK